MSIRIGAKKREWQDSELCSECRHPLSQHGNTFSKRAPDGRFVIATCTAHGCTCSVRASSVRITPPVMEADCGCGHPYGLHQVPHGPGTDPTDTRKPCFHTGCTCVDYHKPKARPAHHKHDVCTCGHLYVNHQKESADGRYSECLHGGCRCTKFTLQSHASSLLPQPHGICRTCSHADHVHQFGTAQCIVPGCSCMAYNP